MYETSVVIIGLLLAVLSIVVAVFNLIDVNKLISNANEEGRQSDQKQLNRIRVFSIILLCIASLAVLFLIIIPIASNMMMPSCNSMVGANKMMPSMMNSRMMKPMMSRPDEYLGSPMMFNNENCNNC